MKGLVFICCITLGCASLDKDWKTQRTSQSAYQEQRYQEQVETVRKQVPEARPNF